MDPGHIDHLRMESSLSTDTSGTLSASPQASTFSGSGNSSVPQYIPTRHGYRTLVLCFDGTGDQFDTDNSNIVEFFGLLKKDDPSVQLVYYQAGIGTYTIPQIATPMFAKFSKMVDSAIARNLDAHIMSGYEFLMQNYRAHDRICIFGFSRGAYTARCLAGMIHKIGLLPACNHQQIPFAYKMYTRADDLGWKQSNAFKKTFSIDVDIEFLGVWDSVNSVGLIPRRLPFTTSNTVVCTFRHALALDERRARFKANLWNRPRREEELLSISDQKLLEHDHKSTSSPKSHHKHTHTLRVLENIYGKDRRAPTDVDEVWFAGCHCDVGGGSIENGVKPCLARIPLRWMIRECFKTNSGIIFHTDGMKEIGLDPASLIPSAHPRPPAIAIDTSPGSPKVFISEIPKKHVKSAATCSLMDEKNPTASEEESQQTEEDAEFADSLAPIYDQLSLKWYWWILELAPMKHRFQAKDNQWKWTFSWNLGSGRYIPRQSSSGVRVHRSVKTRLDAEYEDGKKYWPKSNLELENVTWVD
ncbi:hypothetical protein BYT27DRAFT_7182384 [Phlegmacium glaucopus]|nr:hypothetical protein BYT27DRAFT_7182384 [Phlegmacium glaucopus]